MNFSVTVLLFILILTLYSCVTKTADKGPFMSKVISIKYCNETSLPRLNPKFGPVDSLHVELYNTTKKIHLIRGNFSLQKHRSIYMLKVEGNMWREGKWQPYVFFPEIDCRHIIMNFLIKMCFHNFKYDPSTCTIPKGTYTFSKVDVDVLEHLWSNEREFGRIMWKAELVTKYNTLMCMIIETILEPLKELKRKQRRS